MALHHLTGRDLHSLPTLPVLCLAWVLSGVVGGAKMRTFAAALLAFALIGVPVAAAQSALSFVIELSAGTMAAAVPFYTVLLSTTETSQPYHASLQSRASTKDIVLGLVVPPIAAGAAVAYAGSLFGVTGPSTALAAILGASVGEVFALQLWELDIPEWAKTIAIPIITSLGATFAFSRQAHPSH